MIVSMKCSGIASLCKVVTLAALVLVCACTRTTALRPFTSDGCSLFPDSSVIGEDDWCECCFEHDIAYWQGGTAAQREAADLKLKRCVAAATGNDALAAMMYEGVRLGGSPYFYNWYRWGYGWSFERKYQPLTEAEQQSAARLLSDYRQSQPVQVCKGPTSNNVIALP